MNSGRITMKEVGKKSNYLLMSEERRSLSLAPGEN